MIAVEEAIDLVLKNSFPLKKTEILPINQCLNRNLAKAVKAPIDLPSFRLSSMDGYAINSLNNNENRVFQVVGMSAAGNPTNVKITSNEAVRILFPTA